jgi:hypothetical protein
MPDVLHAGRREFPPPSHSSTSATILGSFKSARISAVGWISAEEDDAENALLRSAYFV